MICKIADFYIEIKTRFRRTKSLCANYICESFPQIDFSVSATDADIAYEREMDMRNNSVSSSSNGHYEELALYRKICAEVLKHDAFLMHGAVIEYEGRGYLFTAKSGTGKTTHIQLWKRLFGEDKVTIINGDKPILRVIDNKIYAYGTPWCGKEGYNTNTRVEICGICFVHRAEENRIRRISAEEALSQLFSQVMITDSTDLAKQLELLDTLVTKTPLYHLDCNMELDAARTAYKGMQE